MIAGYADTGIAHAVRQDDTSGARQHSRKAVLPDAVGIFRLERRAGLSRDGDHDKLGRIDAGGAIAGLGGVLGVHRLTPDAMRCLRAPKGPVHRRRAS